jgi:hypothetical protein
MESLLRAVRGGARLQPVLVAGKGMVAARLYGLDAAPALKALGVTNGDLVLAVRGIANSEVANSEDTVCCATDVHHGIAITVASGDSEDHLRLPGLSR